MDHKNLDYRFWKLLGWGLVAVGLLALTLLPPSQTLLPFDDGLAFAQTGPPPPPSEEEEEGVAPPPAPPTVPGDTCVFLLPPGMPVVKVERLETPPANIPPLVGAGIIARVPATLPITPTQASIPVPSGVITEPVGLIPFDFGPAAVQALGSLIVPADRTRDLIVRVEVLPPESVPIPIFAPNVVPRNWYVDPHPPQTNELGYGAPIPILAPGVVETNYERYAAKVGLPVSPIPPPDAAAAGVIETQPLAGNAVSVEAVFKLDLFYADTGEEISIHVPELALLTCYGIEFDPNTPVLLRANEIANRYDIPVQAFNRLPAGMFQDRIRAYFLETSTFVVAAISGEVRPPLVPGQEFPASSPTPVIPAGLPRTGSGGGTLALFGILFVAAVSFATILGWRWWMARQP